MRSSPPVTVGLALAGGGARGVAHIGILEVLQDHGVRVDRLAGTSAGAIIAAMFASRPDAAWVEQRFREFLDSGAFEALGTERLARQHNNPEGVNPFGKRIKHHVAVNLSLMRQYVIPRDKMNRAIEFLVPARRFQDLEIPLTICAADIQKGRIIRYSEGDLVHALSNSASIPGVLEAEVTPKTIIVDGGVLCPVPVDALESDVDFVIASEISRRGLPPLNDISIFSLMMRSEQLTQRALAQHQARQADFLFSPNVMALHWSQFGAFDELLENGRQEGRERIEALTIQLKRAGRLSARTLRSIRRWLRSRSD